MPRNIIRGVILNALYNVGMADPLAARIIYLTGLNFYPYTKLSSEKSLVAGMLNSFGEIAERNAADEWAFTEEAPQLKLGTLKVGNLKFEPVKLDEAQLKEKFQEAFKNTATGYGPQHGLHDPNYQPHFVSKTTSAIASSFNSALEGLNKSLSSTDVENSISKFFTEFKKSLDTNLKISFSSLTAVERRSKLLWWKETLYSPSQKRGYRGLDKNLLPILMSADLNDQVPEITPISVDYLLKDTLFLLCEKQDESITFSDYLSKISKNENKAILKSYFETADERDGRISITDFISLLIDDRTKISNFREKTGIEAKERITLGDLSIIILHDLLIQRLITL